MMVQVFCLIKYHFPCGRYNNIILYGKDLRALHRQLSTSKGIISFRLGTYLNVCLV